jgi:hypothetical protein
MVAGVAGLLVSFGALSTAANAQDSSTQPASTAVKSDVPVLPYQAGEAVKLYQAGVNKAVIRNFVNNTPAPYHLNADQIIYLQRVGMPVDVTQAMIQKDIELQQQASAQQSNLQYASEPTRTLNDVVAEQQAEAQAAAQAQPGPEVTVIGSSYPTYPVFNYGYSYPYWDYPVIIGGGWGGGWGHWGYRGGFHGGFRGGFHGGGFHGGFGGHGGFSGHGGHGGGHR